MAQQEAELGERACPRPAKRARVAVACTRCKTRKQKCDGAQQSCGNCKSQDATCEYIVPSKTMPYGKYKYVKALEGRVVELETALAAAGLPDLGKDHWEEMRQNEALNGINPPLQSPMTERGPSSNFGATVAPNSRSMRPQGAVYSELESTAQYLTDLSLEAGGGYVGDESSNITVGHMFRSMVHGRESTPLPKNSQPTSHLSPKSVSQGSESATLEVESWTNELSRISEEIAEVLLKAYLKHISTRWLALYRPQILYLHRRRRELDDPFDISSLNLVYAIAGRFLETTGVTGNFYPERHYVAALGHLDKVLQFHDIRSIQTLLLHAIYCLRAPRGLSAWTHVGLALRICIEKGIHRKTYAERPSIALEMRKRIFWSCYCLDRQVSIILGRPFAISDRDIDLELPIDIDDSMNDAQLGEYLLNPPAPLQSTSLSCFIHTTRLRLIESHIQQSVYRVDKLFPLPPATVKHFLASLQAWKDAIPTDPPLQDPETDSYDGHDYYMLYYYKCLRFLLYPSLTTPDVDISLLIKCAEACGGVCRTYKRLHRQTSIGFSLMALYSVFLSGLTLLYCMWLSPAEVYNIGTSNDINACSIVLYVITERWPGARMYRDAFESIKQCILELVEEGGQQPRQKLKALDANSELRDVVREVGNLHPEGRKEFGRMMSDMVGAHRNGTPAGSGEDLGSAHHQQIAGQEAAFADQGAYAKDPGAANGVSNLEPSILYAVENGQELMKFYSIEDGNQMAVGMDGIDGQEPLPGPDMLDDFDMEDFLANLNPLEEVLM